MRDIILGILVALTIVNCIFTFKFLKVFDKILKIEQIHDESIGGLTNIIKDFHFREWPALDSKAAQELSEIYESKDILE